MLCSCWNQMIHLEYLRKDFQNLCNPIAKIDPYNLFNIHHKSNHYLHIYIYIYLTINL